MANKSTDGGQEIDFNNLGQEQTERIKKAIKVVAEYIGEQRAAGESIRDTLEALAVDSDANKESAKKLKKYTRAAARAYALNKSKDVQKDNDGVESFLHLIGEI